MRILVLGAGAIGGYYGGQAGGSRCPDVTFLVRPRRAQSLAAAAVSSSAARSATSSARSGRCLAGGVRESFDLVLLSCKAYDLDSAIEAIAPAVGPHAARSCRCSTASNHMAVLAGRFGAERVLGGACGIGVLLEPSGAVRHVGSLEWLTFGEVSGEALGALPTPSRGSSPPPRSTPRSMTTIMQAMWDKFVMLALAGRGEHSLTRANVGEMLAAAAGRMAGAGSTRGMRAQSPPPMAIRRPRQALERTRKMLTTRGSVFTASMQRDLVAGGATEGDHIIGDLVRRADRRGVEDVPLLRIALANLQVHEARRRNA